MDLLSFVGLATRRRDEFFKQAKTLARKYKEQPLLEKQMEAESLALVNGYRDKLMRWDEYERTLMEKTLKSALASVYIGASNNKPDEKMEQAWPIIVGDMLPPLTKFLAETKEYIDTGVLKIGDHTQDFADYDLLGAVPGGDHVEIDIAEDFNPADAGRSEARQRRAQGRSWPSLVTRVINYLARPTFSFFNLGRYMVAQDLGYKQMRRVAKDDKKTCVDCRRYDSLGWQPVGELPMPGKGCRCFARCRCYIEYQ